MMGAYHDPFRDTLRFGPPDEANLVDQQFHILSMLSGMVGDGPFCDTTEIIGLASYNILCFWWDMRVQRASQ